MTTKETIAYWLRTATDDWRTVQHLFEKREYVNALFFAHLHLEKLLKAAVVQNTQNSAPWGHKLIRLAQEAQLPLTPDRLDLLHRVTEYNLKTRYPDAKFEFRKKCTRKFCQTELDEIEKFSKWLRKQIKP